MSRKRDFISGACVALVLAMLGASPARAQDDEAAPPDDGQPAASDQLPAAAAPPAQPSPQPRAPTFAQLSRGVPLRCDDPAGFFPQVLNCNGEWQEMGAAANSEASGAQSAPAIAGDARATAQDQVPAAAAPAIVPAPPHAPSFAQLKRGVPLRCDDPAGFFPQVSNCKGEWQEVAAPAATEAATKDQTGRRGGAAAASPAQSAEHAPAAVLAAPGDSRDGAAAASSKLRQAAAASAAQKPQPPAAPAPPMPAEPATQKAEQVGVQFAKESGVTWSLSRIIDNAKNLTLKASSSQPASDGTAVATVDATCVTSTKQFSLKAVLANRGGDAVPPVTERVQFGSGELEPTYFHTEESFNRLELTRGFNGATMDMSPARTLLAVAKALYEIKTNWGTLLIRVAPYEPNLRKVVEACMN